MVTADQLDASARLAPRVRPSGKPCGFQRWHELLFVHWRLPPEALAPLIPSPLELDVWNGDAWLGVVAFRMSGIRPRWFPALPWVSSFPETNLRTYVHQRGKAPGVLFLSLDAANRLAVRVARTRWRLPYYFSRMSVIRAGDRIEYRSLRSRHQPAGRSHFVAQIGAPGRSLASDPISTAPGSLEFFLAERYFMYVPELAAPCHRIWRGQVHHRAYPMKSADLLAASETLSTAVGLSNCEAPSHAMFSEGVDVEVFRLHRIA